MPRPGATRERMLALFALGVLLFNPPILSLFSTDGFVAGIPILYLYLFAVWAVFILLLFVSAGWRDAVLSRPWRRGAAEDEAAE